MFKFIFVIFDLKNLPVFRKTIDFDIHTKSFTFFEEGDGLGDISFRAGSSQQDIDGYIYFGNRRGITRLHPEKIVQNTTPPPVFITEVKTISTEGKKTLSIVNQEEITIPHNSYYVSIEFSAINYNGIEKNTYAYKLEGFEENWNYSNNNNI